jgi:hypothetical protein
MWDELKPDLLSMLKPACMHACAREIGAVMSLWHMPSMLAELSNAGQDLAQKVTEGFNYWRASQGLAWP